MKDSVRIFLNVLIKQALWKTLKSHSHMFYLLQWYSFKNDEKCFLFIAKKSFSFLTCSNFCPDLVDHTGKQFNKKAKI